MKLLLSASLAALAAIVTASPETYAISLVGVVNQTAIGQGIHTLDYSDSTGAPTSASKSMSFTGMDGNGNTQTMDWSGTTTTSAEFGRLHSYTAGTLNNSYYNVGNAAYQNPDDSVNPAGSPTTMCSLGFAGFNDTLQFGGVLQAGYRAQYIFHVDGTNSGVGYLADMGVKIANDADESFFAFDPGYNVTNWVTTGHLIDGTNPQNIHVQFSTQAVFDTYNLTDGQNYTSVSDFSSTVTLAGIEMFDANGNVVTGWTVTSGSGTVYPQAVPEPSSMLALAGLALPLLRRRRRNAR